MGSREPGKERIAPATIRYIKLGPGGAWEGVSLDGGRIDWGNAADPHELAAAAHWEAAKQAYLDAGVLPSTATAYLRELKDFEAGSVRGQAGRVAGHRSLAPSCSTTSTATATWTSPAAR